MLHWYAVWVLSSLSLEFSNCADLFDIHRYSSSYKDGKEPYLSKNVFVNENKLCYFAYCWNMNARCLNTYGCCQCVCNGGSTFYSSANGCKTPSNLRGWTKSEGTECLLFSSKLGRNYVPLFADASKFSSIELSLFPDSGFEFYDENVTCVASYLYEYDYHGHRLLIHTNKCQSMFTITNRDGFHYAHFIGDNAEVWEKMKGKLLALNVHCDSNDGEIDTCFLFQIEGKFTQGAHEEEAPTVSPDYVCPTTIATTTTTVSTASKETEQHTTIYTYESTHISTQVESTQKVFNLPSSGDDKKKSTSNVSIGVGISLSLIIVIAAIAIFIIFKRKVVTKKALQRRADALLSSIRSKKNVYEENGGVLYTEADDGTVSPSVEDENAYLRPVTDTSYQYIDAEDSTSNARHEEEEHLYEPTNSALCNEKHIPSRPTIRLNSSVRSETNMKTRPLPATPVQKNDVTPGTSPIEESSNPYYRPVSQIEPENEDSGPNELYTIYSSIDEEAAI